MPPAMPAGRTVHAYNLFGESADLPDVVHCETIAARSVLHEWEFAPHRHPRLHQILLIERGGGQASLEGRTQALRPMRVVNVPVGDVHGFRFKPGTQGWVLTVAAEMLDEALTPSEGLRRVLAHSTVLRGTPEMRAAMQQIFSEFAGRHFARAHMLRALEQHFLQHWTVSDYAAALSITPTHLSRVTRAATGHAASHVILERVIREARRNLVYTNLPVSTIAYSLGFSDPAYFSRLFSGATGRSPRSFRDKVHTGG